MPKKPRRRIHIRYRPAKERWELDYRINGFRHRPLFESEEAALARAHELAEELADSTPPLVENPDITLAEYYAQRRALWEKTNVWAARTLRGIEEGLTRHWLPALGTLPVRAIRPRHVKQLLTQKQVEGYSANTVRLIKCALSAVLGDAVDDELVKANVCLQLGRRRGRQPGTALNGGQQVRPLTREQLEAFLKAASEQPLYGALFSVMAKTGLRPSEALALQPGDIDWRAGQLRVERALDLDRTIKAVKTYETRTVDLTPDLLATLRRYLTWLKAQALRRGWGDPTWLFASDVGTPLDYANVSKVFHRCLKKAGLPHFRVYDLRHTYASLLLSARAPLLYVAMQLGHRKPTTTLKYYAHWIPREGQRWVNLLDGESVPVQEAADLAGERLASHAGVEPAT